MVNAESQFRWLAGFASARLGIRCFERHQRLILRLESSSCDRGVLRHIQSQVGGTVRVRPSDEKGHNGRHQHLYRWRLSGNRAVVLLSGLSEHMVSRRQVKAEKVLRLVTKRNGKNE